MDFCITIYGTQRITHQKFMFKNNKERKKERKKYVYLAITKIQDFITF